MKNDPFDITYVKVTGLYEHDNLFGAYLLLVIIGFVTGFGLAYILR
jgi:hypothetical protein